jgi:surfeit locus 1 family protein
MNRSRRARLMVALCAALLCIGLFALGCWQLQRLQWKLTLIAQVDQRVHAAPAAAPAVASWPLLSKQNDEYRHLRLEGRFLDELATRVQASTILGAGYWLLTPFRSDDGATVLVNRGFIPTTTALPAGTQHVSITGLLRMSERGGAFLRDNNPIANRWYARDVQAIAAARGLGPVAPYFLDLDATQPAVPGAPVGGLTVIAFNTNHLVYALTWFALSLMAAAGGVVVARTGDSTDKLKG